MFDSLEERVKRLELAADAQRLIGLYTNDMAEKQFDRIPELFALDTPQLCAEMLWGCYDGREGIERLYLKLLPALTHGEEGIVYDWAQTMEVPVITPAKDGKTVKAVWVSPGYMTLRQSDGSLMGYWSYQKYGCDFIYTDAGLRIWHLHVYGLFEGMYDAMDVQSAGLLLSDSEAIRRYAPDRPSTTKFELTEDSIYPYSPAVPKPYYVFDQDDRY